MIKKWSENHIPSAAYREFSADIARYNLTALHQISLVGMTGSLLLVIASLPPLHLLRLLHGYFSITVLFTTVFILSCTVLKKHARMILPVYYGFITLVLTVALVMGTYWGPTTNATTFVMLIIVMPMLIIDRPYRLNLLIAVLCVAFCIVDAYVKEGLLLQLDIANCIIFYLLGAIISRQMIRAKISDIIIKHELKQQRDMDMLTKLSNRGAFERIVAQYIHISGQSAVLMIMDIDNFKTVNDTMGHAYGDTVLQLVGTYLRETFRSSDTVSRLGGDEFVVFLPAAQNMETIRQKAIQLTRRVSAIRIDSDTPCSIGASIGLARYPQDGCSFDELYKRADEALYLAKKNGKGKCVLYGVEN